eukprot:s6922_g1.t1
MVTVCSRASQESEAEGPMRELKLLMEYLGKEEILSLDCEGSDLSKGSWRQGRLQLAPHTGPRAGKGIAIIVDEANIALPRDDDLTEAKAARDALAEIVSITKQNLKASVVLISSEHGYPFKLAKADLNLLAKADLNLVDIKNIIIAPEVPPVDMFKMLTDHWGMGHRLARLFVATYGGSIDAVYTALGNLINNRKQFYPLGTTSDDAREHLINIALDGFSPVSDYETDEGAIRASAKNVFHETDEEYVLVASTHHVRLKICEALLNKGYIQNNGGNLARVSPNTSSVR